MKVSIITVCYNSEATIEATIKSVLAQSHSDIEYLVVDGASTDNTLAIIEKYKSKISKLISEKDSGMYYAINKGIALASGDVIAILNSDDVYANQHVIANVVAEFVSTGADSIYGDLQYVSRDNSDKIIRHWKSKPYCADLFFKGWMPPHPAFFVKRFCYEKFGCFNTGFKISADYELMLRLLYKYKITTSYIPQVLVKMKTGGLSNVTIKSRLQANLEDRKAWKINELKAGSMTLIFKPLSKLRQFFNK